jgi:hypothetical protein
MNQLNWKLKEKIGGLTCGSLLNTRQPSTCLRDKAELLVVLFTDIHPAAINQNCTGNIQQESRQMTKFLSIWAAIDACTACSDFNPGGHDSYPLAYIGSTFEESFFTQPCCTSMRLLHTSNEITTQEQSGLFHSEKSESLVLVLCKSPIS